jgi:hypothetical protein
MVWHRRTAQGSLPRALNISVAYACGNRVAAPRGGLAILAINLDTDGATPGEHRRQQRRPAAAAWVEDEIAGLRRAKLVQAAERV